MPLPASALAPNRQKLLTFVSPKVADILFMEVVDAQRIRKGIPAYGTPHPDKDRWPDHELVFAKVADDQGLFYQYYYAAKREAQDDYNFQYGATSIAKREFPMVERVYVIPRAEFNASEPRAGTAMPTGPDGKFTGLNYILLDREQLDAGEPISSLYVVEKRIYVQKYVASTIGVDDLNGKPLVGRTYFFYADEVVSGGLTAAQLFSDPTNAYWGLQSSGIQRTGQQITDEWFLVDESQVVSGTAVANVIPIHDYFTTEDYTWPAVFGGVTQYDYDLKPTQNNPLGGTETYVEPYLSKEAYRGPCKAQVQVDWSATEFVVDPPQVMQPLPISVNTPFYSFSVGPCLHEADEIVAFINGDHPKYESVTGNIASWGATNPTDWPSSIVAVDEQKPYRGGWLRTKVTIFPPTFPTPPTP